MRRSGTLLIAVAFVAVALAACSSDGNATSDERDGTITVYSGREEELVGPLFERFEADTGIDVRVRYADSADLALQIEQEGDATPADIFFSQSPGSVAFLANEGLLGELPEDVLGRVDERFESDDARWIGVTGRQRVLVYNEELVSEDELPPSVLDLTDERFRGRVGVAPSNGSFQDFVSALRQQEGDDTARAWLEGMAANDSLTYADNSAIVDAVARGEVETGLVNHYYNLLYLRENPDATTRNYVFPNGDIGALVIASTVSVLEPSDNDRSGELIDYLLSEEGQQYFVEEEVEYPLATDVEPSADLPPLEDLDAPDVDIRDLGEEFRGTVEMISESGLD